MPLHLIISNAGPPGGVPPAELPLPGLAALLARLVPEHTETAGDDALAAPHERVLARLLGLPPEDGRIPWAAWRVHALGGAPGDGAWAELTPAHWDIGMTEIRMGLPEDLALAEDEASALFGALQPLFAGPGQALYRSGALAWLARDPAFAGLASAPADRVVGRNLVDWLPEGPGAGAVRRLQNEVQMLLHDHRVNRAREARRAPTVNTVWVSGCGVLPASAASALPEGVRHDDRLRLPRLRGDLPAWTAAWRELDAGPVRAALAALALRDNDVRLTLCGEHAARTWRTPPSRWAAWRRRWQARPDVAGTLAAL